jgi:hypothetical protein
LPSTVDGISAAVNGTESNDDVILVLSLVNHPSIVDGISTAITAATAASFNDSKQSVPFGCYPDSG